MIVIMLVYVIANIVAFNYENRLIELTANTWIMVLPAVFGTIYNSYYMIKTMKVELAGNIIPEYQYLISSRQMSFVLCDVGFFIMGVLVIVFGENYRKTAD